MMRQPVGVRVERRVAQLAVLEHHRDRIRRARRLRGKQLPAAWRGGDRLRGVVPALAGCVRALRRRRGCRGCRSAASAPQPPPSSSRTSRSPAPRRSRDRTGRADSRAAAAAARPACTDQRQRIMRRVVPARHRPSRSPPACRRQRAAVDRIVLEHHQRVEQTRPSRPAPGSRPGPDAGAPSAATGCPASPRAAPTAAARGGSRTRSGSVLMNSPTIRSMPAISGGRPATVTPNTTSSRPVSRPSSIAHAACRIVFSVSALLARACRLSAAVSARSSASVDLLGHRRGLRLRSTAAHSRVPSSSPAKRLAPGRQRRRAVLRRDATPDSRGTASPAAATPRCRAAAHRACSNSRTSTGVDQPSIRM